MASDHILALVRSRLSQIGVDDVTLHANWQQKFASTDTAGWAKVYEEMKAAWPLIDGDGRLGQFIKHSRMKILSSKKSDEPEPPEEIVAAIEEALKIGDEAVLLQMDSNLHYPEIVRALSHICLNTLNRGVPASESYRFKMPYIISNEKVIEGMVSSGLFEGPKSIPLLNVWYPVKSEDMPYYQFFGVPSPKAGFRKVATFNEEFFIYRFRNNDAKEYLLFSRERLKLEPSKITGMSIPQNDWVKVGELAKIPVATTIFFVNKQESDIMPLTAPEFKTLTSLWTFPDMEKMIFGSYLQPPWFEKMTLAWLLSAKYSGYPLHLGVLSPPGTGKTFFMEGLAQAVGDKVFGGGTIRGLVPSFGQAQPKEGYFAECRRVALVDEFLSIVKSSSRSGGSEEIDSGTDKMLRIYEHKDEDYASGKGKIKIAPRMKVILVSNNNAYVKMKTLVDISNQLYPAFLSRSLWYVLTPEHKAFVDKNKNSVALLDRTTALAQRSPDFIRVMDYLGNTPIVKQDVMAKLQATIDEYHQYVPSELIEKIYEPRALHQLICLTDGYAKVNSIIEHRPELTVTDDDIKEAASTFGNVIMSWLNEVKIQDVPIGHRHQFLPQNLREVYDFVGANKPVKTPDLKIRGYTMRQLLQLRDDYGLLATVLDVDGTTCIWYPHWAKI